MDYPKVKNIIEAALFAAAKPLSAAQLEKLFDGTKTDLNIRDSIRQALKELEVEYAQRGYELKKVSSGYRVQVCQELEPWISKLWTEKPPRYSRALLETLSIIAYRQPITRGEIEYIRGVAVSTNITRTLLEREWVRVVGHRDAPGKPEMFGTTKQFLDYFNLKSLDELPTLAELRDLEQHHLELDLEGTQSLLNEAEQQGSETEPAESNVVELPATAVPDAESLH